MKHRHNAVSRREFLAQSAALGAGALLTIGAPNLADGARTLPTTTLGKTGAKVPILGMGGSQKITLRQISAAVNEGVTFYDNSESYGNGNSERSLGEILERLNKRKDCFIVTKVKRHEVDSALDALPKSLERLRTDYVDAYYLHNLSSPNRLDNEMKSLAEKLKKEKKIRFFGFSCHARQLVQCLERAAEVGYVDLIMFKYNFWDYDNDALNRAIDRCAKANIGLVAMKTQGGAATVPEKVEQFKARGFNPFQAALKAVWDDDRIHVAVSEMANVQHVRENAIAAREKQLGATEQKQLEQYAAENSRFYCRGCGHICESRTDGSVNIADTLRYRLYHDGYGKPSDARRLFYDLPTSARNIAGIDFSTAEKACPYNLPIGQLMADAVQKLA